MVDFESYRNAVDGISNGWNGQEPMAVAHMLQRAASISRSPPAQLLAHALVVASKVRALLEMRESDPASLDASLSAEDEFMDQIADAASLLRLALPALEQAVGLRKDET